MPLEKPLPEPQAPIHESPDLARFAVAAGMGVFAFGMLTTGLASMAVIGLIAGPAFIARGFLAASR
jgi:hypothetical protein